VSARSSSCAVIAAVLLHHGARHEWRCARRDPGGAARTAAAGGCRGRRVGRPGVADAVLRRRARHGRAEQGGAARRRGGEAAIERSCAGEATRREVSRVQAGRDDADADATGACKTSIW
jgi:hypothetical protein